MLFHVLAERARLIVAFAELALLVAALIALVAFMRLYELSPPLFAQRRQSDGESINHNRPLCPVLSAFRTESLEVCISKTPLRLDDIPRIGPTARAHWPSELEATQPMLS
jgi:hypothetical protein